MSAVETRQKSPDTLPDLANRPRQLIFFNLLNNPLSDFSNEIHQIARFEPAIVERIDEDLDLHARKKKLLRIGALVGEPGPNPTTWGDGRIESLLKDQADAVKSCGARTAI